jgi:hypothetical protein
MVMLFVKRCCTVRNYGAWATEYTVAGKAIGFALEQTLRDAALTVFSFGNLKTALVYIETNK